jgi:D-3-phosphoglycerate dehydrogenase
MEKIGVITPVSHLKGVKDLISSKGDAYYLETGSKKETRDFLIKNNIKIIICNPNQQSYIIDKELLEDTKVRKINTCSTGLNHIDLEYCKLKKIKIESLTSDYELLNDLPSTSELAFGLLLDLARKITVSNNYVKETKDWNYMPFVGSQIKDMKIGIIGYGRLGKMMYNFCNSFGAEVYIYDPYKEVSNVSSLKELFKICDAISLHVHVNEETKHMINKDILDIGIKYLINTSRGEIVNESDVISALKSGKLKGYGADVIEEEFGFLEKSLFFKDENKGLNFILTPHVGGMTIEGQQKAYKWSIEKI